MSAARVDLNREKGKPKVAPPTPWIRVFGERRGSCGCTYFVGSLLLVGGDLARCRWFGIGRMVDEISMVSFFFLITTRSIQTYRWSKSQRNRNFVAGIWRRVELGTATRLGIVAAQIGKSINEEELRTSGSQTNLARDRGESNLLYAASCSTAVINIDRGSRILRGVRSWTGISTLGFRS